MAVAAHPDDIDIWCGGALARAIDAGATVRLLLVTFGDNGAADPGATSEQVAARREQEAKEAAARLGIEEVAFPRYPDGGGKIRKRRGAIWWRGFPAGDRRYSSRTIRNTRTRPI